MGRIDAEATWTTLLQADFKQIITRQNITFEAEENHSMETFVSMQNVTHLSCEKLWVFSTLCEEEHVYEVNEDAGSELGIGRCVRNPLIDHQEHQVAKEADHEDELRDEHKEDFVDLAKVTEKTLMMTTRGINTGISSYKMCNYKKKSFEWNVTSS